jgi:hypothetical protein
MLICLVVGCGGSDLIGGSVVPAGEEPKGPAIRRYVPEGCVDVKGQPVLWPTTLTLVGQGDRQILIETRPGYDSIVLRDPRRDGADVVFTLTIGRIRREVRLAADGGPGSMRAMTQRPVLRCRLRSEAPEGQAPAP